MNECQNCSKQNCSLRCSRCHLVYYCNRECQVAHWKAKHKRDCINSTRTKKSKKKKTAKVVKHKTKPSALSHDASSIIPSSPGQTNPAPKTIENGNSNHHNNNISNTNAFKISQTEKSDDEMVIAPVNANATTVNNISNGDADNDDDNDCPAMKQFIGNFIFGETQIDLVLNVAKQYYQYFERNDIHNDDDNDNDEKTSIEQKIRSVVKRLDVITLIMIDSYLKKDYNDEWKKYLPCLEHYIDRDIDDDINSDNDIDIGQYEKKKCLLSFLNWIRNDDKLIYHWELKYIQLYKKLENEDSIKKRNYNLSFKHVHWFKKSQIFDKLKGICFHLIYLAGLNVFKNINDNDNSNLKEKKINKQSKIDINSIMFDALKLACIENSYHSIKILAGRFNNIVVNNINSSSNKNKNNNSSSSNVKLSENELNLMIDGSKYVCENYGSPGCFIGYQANIFLGYYYKRVLKQYNISDMYFYKAYYYICLTQQLLNDSQEYIYELFFGCSIKQWIDAIQFKIKSFDNARNSLQKRILKSKTTQSKVQVTQQCEKQEKQALKDAKQMSATLQEWSVQGKKL